MFLLTRFHNQRVVENERICSAATCATYVQHMCNMGGHENMNGTSCGIYGKWQMMWDMRYAIFQMCVICRIWHVMWYGMTWYAYAYYIYLSIYLFIYLCIYYIIFKKKVSGYNDKTFLDKGGKGAQLTLPSQQLECHPLQLLLSRSRNRQHLGNTEKQHVCWDSLRLLRRAFASRLSCRMLPEFQRSTFGLVQTE